MAYTKEMGDLLSALAERRLMAIVHCLHRRQMTAADIAKAVSRDVQDVQHDLRSMLAKGIVTSIGNGWALSSRIQLREEKDFLTYEATTRDGSALTLRVPAGKTHN